MVSQAWRRHERDRRLVSLGTHQINEVMFLQEAADRQHEVFVGQLCMGEVYSDVQRIATAAQARGHKVWPTLMLDTGWDFTNYKHQRMALDLVLRTRPQFLMIAFPCGQFSPLQRLSAARAVSSSSIAPASNAQKEVRWRNACRLARFAVKVAELQLHLGAHMAKIRGTAWPGIYRHFGLFAAICECASPFSTCVALTCAGSREICIANLLQFLLRARP